MNGPPPMPGALPSGRSRGQLVAEVARQLESVPKDATVVLALSGGPDSTALAYLATEARGDLDVVLAHVAHGLRDADAQAADLEVVRTHADWLGCDLEVADVEVAAAGHGIEAAARDARYAALRTVADERNAAAILVGHSADDQAETVLLRAARGTGIDGLAAMAAVSGDLVRPLLRLRRADLRSFVELEGLPVADDETNRSDEVRRVRVRTELLPALERIGPDPVGALTRLADLARDDAELVRQSVATVDDAWRQVGEVAIIDRTMVASCSAGLHRRIVRDALCSLADEAPSTETVQRVLSLSAGQRATLPGGLRVGADRRWISLEPAEDDVQTPCAVPLARPGATAWPAVSVAIEVMTAQSPAQSGDQIALELPEVWSPPAVSVPAEVVPPGGQVTRASVLLPSGFDDLEVRAPLPGDRIRSGGGTRRLVDVFRDAGVPRALRSRWPVVTVDGWIVWLPGIEADVDVLAAGRADPATQLHLTI